MQNEATRDERGETETEPQRRESCFSQPANKKRKRKEAQTKRSIAHPHTNTRRTYKRWKPNKNLILFIVFLAGKCKIIKHILQFTGK